MCENCNVSDEIRSEIDNLSEEALGEIVRVITDEVANKNDIMIASILTHLDLTEVTLTRETVQGVNEKLVSGAVRLDGSPSADDESFTFSLKEGEPEDGLVALMKALGIA